MHSLILAVVIVQSSVAVGTDPSCLLAADTGSCQGSFERFFYNPSSEICETFTYGGCGGNNNNFPTLDRCKETCGKTNWREIILW